MNERKVYLDILRICGALGVICIHTLPKMIGGNDTIVQTLLNVVSCSVPLFVMISGACIFRKAYTVVDILQKVFRLYVCFLIWACVYAVLDVVINYIQVPGYVLDPFGVLSILVCGQYHMWFLYMIMGLYITVPFVQRFIHDKNLVVLFLIVSFVVSFVFPLLETTGIHSFSVAIERLHISYFNGYIFYFIWGYYLDQLEHQRMSKMIVMLGLVSFIAGYFFRYHGDFAIFTMLYASAVFLCVKLVAKHVSEKSVLFLSKQTFGVYLVHVLVMEILLLLGVHNFGLPLLTTIVSFLAVGGCHCMLGKCRCFYRKK